MPFKSINPPRKCRICNKEKDRWWVHPKVGHPTGQICPDCYRDARKAKREESKKSGSSGKPTNINVNANRKTSRSKRSGGRRTKQVA